MQAVGGGAPEGVGEITHGGPEDTSSQPGPALAAQALRASRFSPSHCCDQKPRP